MKLKPTYRERSKEDAFLASAHVDVLGATPNDPCVSDSCSAHSLQMYKALEAGYQMGLESLNENLSEIRAELIFSQRRLQYKPPLEELRAAYYRDTKKFVSIPNHFDGFGNGKVSIPSRLVLSSVTEERNGIIHIPIIP